MLTIKLFITSDSDNVINKTLTDVATVTGDFNDSLDINSPVVRIGGLADVGEYNYCFIPELNRYYFINEYIIERASYFILYLECDLLMSYRPIILQLTGVVRSGANSNPFSNGYINGFDVRQDSTKLYFENGSVFNSKGVNVMTVIRGI